MKKIFVLLFLAACSPAANITIPLIPYRKGDKWGFCDKQKQIMIEPIYQQVGFFNPMYGQTLAKVKINGKYGLIDKRGKQVLPCKYEEVVQISKDFIKVKRQGKWQLKHASKRTSKVSYDDISQEGMSDLENPYFMVKEEQQVSLIDARGKRIISGSYDKISITYHKQLFEVSSNGKKGMFDLTSHQLVIPAKYDNIAPFYFRTNKGKQLLFMVWQNQKVGVFDPIMSKFAIPIKYDEVAPVQFARFQSYIVSLGNKKGVCSNTHQTILPVKYDFLLFRSNPGAYVIGIDNKLGVADPKGKITIPPAYDDIYFDLKKRWFVVELDGKKGTLNQNGKVLGPLAAEKAIPGGNKVVKMKEKAAPKNHLPPPPPPRITIPEPYQQEGKWGYNKTMDTPAIACKYEAAETFNEGRELARVKYKGKWGYIGLDGTEYFED